jgi:hypothetical protein
VPEPNASEDMASATGGLQTQNLLRSDPFTVLDGLADISALAESPIFAALSDQGQRQVIQEIRRVIAVEKLDRGVINVFERVKCIAGGTSVDVDEWMSGGPDGSRKFYMVKFACDISSRIQSHGERSWRHKPIILMQSSTEVNVDPNDDGFIKQQLQLLPTLVIWGSDPHHSAPKPECILHDCMYEEGPLQCVVVPDAVCREWHHGRKRLSSRAAMHHDDSNPFFFKHPGLQSSNWF